MSEEATLGEFVNSAQKFRETKKKTIPDGWRVARADDVIDITRGASPRPKGDPELFGGDIPWVKIGDVDVKNARYTGVTEDTVTEQGAEKSRLVEAGTLLVSNSGTCGYPMLAGVRSCVHDGWLILRDYEDTLSANYLYEYINWKQNYLKSLAPGSTQTNLNTSRFGVLEINIPPLEEQRKIATVLYTVDQAIQKTEKIESQIRHTRKGTVQGVLTHGIGESEVSDTGMELGQLPEHWEVTTIGEIVADEDSALTDGARYSLSSAEIYDEGDARAILLQEVGEGEFDDSNPKFATAEKYEEITHRAIYPGEVVVAKMAEPVARACIVPGTYDKYLLGCADVVRVLTNDEFDDRFLMYCMNSHKLWSQAVAHLRGTGRSRINLENISELKLPKPPLHEQIEIAEAIQQLDEKIENERGYQNQLRRLKQGLMQDLLSGTVRTHEADIDISEAVLARG